MTTSRRAFITKSAAAFAGVQFLPRSVFGANDRIGIAFIGAGGKGGGAVRGLARNELANLVAFADVDERRCVEARKNHPGVPFHGDCRAMLDKHGKSIDAVVVSTPDHTHHFAAKNCMLAGKHVYVEKPLTHNIAEARDLMAMEKETGLACQMGNQGHSGKGIPQLRAYVEAGILGDVTEAHAWAGPRHSYEDARPPTEPVPEGLNWDQWIGPAAMVPYSSAYMPGKWRGWFEFGCGTLGDWACHNMDAPYDVWNLDCPRRVEIESTGPKKLSFPVTARLTFIFPATPDRGEFKVHWYQGENHALPHAPELEADREMGRGGTYISGSKGAVLMGTHAGVPRVIPEVKRRELKDDLPVADEKRSSHWDNWLLGIKGEETCRSNFAYGGRLTETMHFGNIALHVNRSLTIDPATRAIVGDDEAAAMVSHPAPREGWVV